MVHGNVMTIHIMDDGEMFSVIVESENTHQSRAFEWPRRIGKLDGNADAAKEVRNYVLGIVADIDWQSIIQRLG